MHWGARLGVKEQQSSHPAGGAAGNRGGPWSWALLRGGDSRGKGTPEKEHATLGGGWRCPWPAPAYVASGFSRLDSLGHQGQGERPGQRELRLREGASLSWAGRAGKGPVELGLGPQWKCMVRVPREREKVVV